MANETAGEAINSAVGFVVFVAVVFGWSYLNYRNNTQTVYDGCMKEMKIGNPATQDRLCDCAADKFIDDVSLLIHLPFVGRFFVPEDEEAEKIAFRAGQVCAAQNLGM